MFRFFRKKEVSKAAGTLAVGCGGGGCNIVNRLGRISAVDIITVNTDRKGLVRSRSNRRILIGDGSEAGCDGNAELAESLTREASEIINENIKRHLNIVLMVGLGGGTGTGSAKVIAEIARRNGSRVITMATLPMAFEASRRDTALNALNGIKEASDIMVVIDGDRLIRIDPDMGTREAFSVLDQMVCESFMGIIEMLESLGGESLYGMMRGKMFTVSFAEGMNAGKIAKDLVTGTMFDSDIVSGPLIFVRGNMPQDSEDMIRNAITESIGYEPAFVRGPHGQGMNAVMFVPVSVPF